MPTATSIAWLVSASVVAVAALSATVAVETEEEAREEEEEEGDEAGEEEEEGDEEEEDGEEDEEGREEGAALEAVPVTMRARRGRSAFATASRGAVRPDVGSPTRSFIAAFTSAGRPAAAPVCGRAGGGRRNEKNRKTNAKKIVLQLIEEDFLLLNLHLN